MALLFGLVRNAGEQKNAIVYSPQTETFERLCEARKEGSGVGAEGRWKDGTIAGRSPEIPEVVPNELFFPFLLFFPPFTSIPRYLQTGFIRRPRQITQHRAAELVFHLMQETAVTDSSEEESS